MSDAAAPFTTRLEGPAPEVSVSRDIVRRGLIVAPVLVAICGVIWGVDGAWSSAYAIAIVLLNFGLAAALIAVTARISLTLMMAAILFGYLIRLGLIFLAVFLVRDASWISLPALGTSIIVTHLGLLIWEMKYVASNDPQERFPVIAFEFPPINAILRWDDFFPSFNKIALITVLSVVIASALYLVAARRDAMKAPKGVRNVAETSVEFIENGIVMQTMGRDGLGWTPFLLTLFVFIYLCNVPGIIPMLQMPATARIAIPLFLSLIVWVTFIVTGFKHQGIGYLKSTLFPPGVPKLLYILVTPIEFISTFLVRPFSLTVRLLSEALFQAKTNVPFLNIMGVLPFFMLLFLTAFEVLVAFLQAYIFTILTAVYIGGAMHPEH
jgi:F-type H+-transporting ATPase subunit a